MRFVALAMLCLAGCTAAQQQRAVVDGELFCATATAQGPLVVAVADAGGVPISVIGMTQAAVAGICASISAIPVTPPPEPAAAPVVAVTSQCRPSSVGELVSPPCALKIGE